LGHPIPRRTEELKILFYLKDLFGRYKLSSLHSQSVQPTVHAAVHCTVTGKKAPDPQKRLAVIEATRIWRLIQKGKMRKRGPVKGRASKLKRRISGTQG